MRAALVDQDAGEPPKAVEREHIALSAISKRLQDLENEVGAPPSRRCRRRHVSENEFPGSKSIMVPAGDKP
jgi:DNA-binding transcriptional LysR family regulator